MVAEAVGTYNLVVDSILTYRAVAPESQKSTGLYLIPAKHSWDNSSWELLNELLVEIHYSTAEVLATTCLSVQEYGIGSTFEEAVADLLTSLSDYYQSLEARQDRLADAAVNDITKLRQLIRRRIVS